MHKTDVHVTKKNTIWLYKVEAGLGQFNIYLNFTGCW